MDYSANSLTENFLNVYEPIVLNETYLGDIDYFDMAFVDKKFSELKDIEDENEKSKEVAKLLYDVIQNISAACCKAVSLKDLYLKNYRYNHVIVKVCDKYLQYVKDEDKKKIRRAVDSAFKGDWRDGLVKGALGLVVNFIVPKEFKIVEKLIGRYCGNTGAAIYSVAVKKVGKEKAREMGEKVADVSFKLIYPFITDLIRSIPKDIIKGIFFDICPTKFNGIGIALTVYKKSSQPGTFTMKETVEGAKFCFDVTSQVMEDIIKVYRKL